MGVPSLGDGAGKRNEVSKMQNYRNAKLFVKTGESNNMTLTKHYKNQSLNFYRLGAITGAYYLILSSVLFSGDCIDTAWCVPCLVRIGEALLVVFEMRDEIDLSHLSSYRSSPIY